MFNEEMAAVYRTLVDVLEQSGMIESRSRCMIVANEILLSDKLSIRLNTTEEVLTNV